MSIIIRGKCLSEVEEAIKKDNPWIIMGAGSRYFFFLIILLVNYQNFFNFIVCHMI